MYNAKQALALAEQAKKNSGEVETALRVIEAAAKGGHLSVIVAAPIGETVLVDELRGRGFEVAPISGEGCRFEISWGEGK